MDDVLRAAGLEGRAARRYDHNDEWLILIPLAPGEALRVWETARDGLRGRHCPVLVRAGGEVSSPEMRMREDPAGVLARAAGRSGGGGTTRDRARDAGRADRGGPAAELREHADADRRVAALQPALTVTRCRSSG